MGLDRRGFISFLVGGAAGTLFTPVPWKIMDDISIWTQNWPWIPRVNKGPRYEEKTTCKMCPAGCPLSIHTIGGKPTVAAGNQEQDITGGGICPLGASAAQMLYSPARVKGPLKKENGKFKSVSWDEAEKLLQAKVSAAGDKVAALSGDENGSANEVLSAFLAGTGSRDFYLMPSDQGVTRRAWKRMNGTGQLGFDVENSDYVLLSGADALSSWGPVVRNQHVFSQRKGKWVYAGPEQNGSGAVTDSWVPVQPGQEAAFLLGIAYHVLRAGGNEPHAKGFARFREYVLSNYTPDKVSELTGASEAQLKKAARDLQAAYYPVVLFGSCFGQGAGELETVAGVFLNMLLGRLNKPGGLVCLPQDKPVVNGAPGSEELAENNFVQFVNEVDRGDKSPQVLLFYEANPFYALPQVGETAKKLAKVPFKVTFSSYMDETAANCDLILPTPTFLERYDDAYTPYGLGKVSYSVSHPVIQPLFDTRQMPDVVLEISSKLGQKPGFKKFKEVLQSKAKKFGASLRKLEKGEVITDNKRVFQDILQLPADLLSDGLQKRSADFPLGLAPVWKRNIGTPRMATTPFEVVTIKDSELKGDSSFVHVNSRTAKKLGLTQGSEVRVQSGRGEARALLDITETVMDNVVAAPLGFGHTAWDEFSRGKGSNMFKAIPVNKEKGSGLPVWNDIQVKLVRA